MWKSESYGIQLSLVELINTNEDVIAVEMSMPSLVSNREMLQRMIWVCNKINLNVVAKYKLHEEKINIVL